MCTAVSYVYPDTKFLVGLFLKVSLHEVSNVKVAVSLLLLFVSLPDCIQNQTAVSDTHHLLFDFYDDQGRRTVINLYRGKYPKFLNRRTGAFTGTY